MDFFAAQDHARKQTKTLVALYCLTVVLIILALYAVVMGVTTSVFVPIDAAPRYEVWWDAEIFLWTTLGVCVIVLGASLYKINALRGGGASVALHLGGVEVNSSTQVPSQRMLLNIVEEMSIASGVPMPKVFVLPNESGINAFAAGYSIHDTAVAVTQGCLDTLNRDQLQGVIAHEFSHILNGDMRLNIRLIGVLFGILVITILGRELMFSVRFTRRSKESGGIILLVLALGLAMLVIGYVGVFFARLIQSAVSRQREYLADAAAVQFTRNPQGIGDALIHIGAKSHGSALSNPHAEENSHAFFAKGVASLFATHPPLPKRIRAILPSWDGVFKVDENKRRNSPSNKKEAKHPPPATAKKTDSFSSLGEFGIESLWLAQTLLDNIDTRLRERIQSADGAQAFIFVLLLEQDDTSRHRQLDLIKNTLGEPALNETQAMWQLAYGISPEQRLPLLELAVPALRFPKASDGQTFLDFIFQLASLDHHISPFEFSLLRIVRQHVTLRAKPPAKSLRPPSLNTLSPALTKAASFVLRLECDDEAECQRILSGALAHAPTLQNHVFYDANVLNLPPQELNAALDQIGFASYFIRKQFLLLCMKIIEHDEQVSIQEKEFFRALACGIECPISVA